MKVLAKTVGYKDQLVKEAIEIQLHSNNINTEEGFKLSQAWNPPINILKTNDADSFNYIGRVTSNVAEKKKGKLQPVPRLGVHGVLLSFPNKCSWHGALDQGWVMLEQRCLLQHVFMETDQQLQDLQNVIVTGTRCEQDTWGCALHRDIWIFLLLARMSVEATKPSTSVR
jgi:hypothetical protein